jgi:alpha-tubulin suppressor-like RCC1 family protein
LAPNAAYPVAGGHVWTKAVAHNEVACGLTPAGELFCWGINAQGSIGVAGAPQSNPTPLRVAPGIGFVDVGLGNRHGCAMVDDVDREILCWGDNAYGQLGNGAAPGDSPVPVPIGMSGPWVGLAVGGDHACAWKEEATSQRAYCWGLNAFGNLGIAAGVTAAVTSPALQEAFAYPCCGDGICCSLSAPECQGTREASFTSCVNTSSPPGDCPPPPP